MCGFMDIRMQCPAKCGLCASETSESKLELVKENEFLEAASDYDYDESNATSNCRFFSWVAETFNYKFQVCKVWICCTFIH